MVYTEELGAVFFRRVLHDMCGVVFKYHRDMHGVTDRGAGQKYPEQKKTGRQYDRNSYRIHCKYGKWPMTVIQDETISPVPVTICRERPFVIAYAES